MRSLRRPVLVKDLTWLVLLGLGVLGVRLVRIQLLQGDHLVAWVDRQRTSVVTIPSRRGMILDATGRVMATSVERPSVFADPNVIPHPRVLPDPNQVSPEQTIAEPNVIREYGAAAGQLASILGLDGAILADELIARAGRRFFWVKRRVSDAEAEAVKALRLRGVGIVHEPERRYPMNERFAHGLGFVNREGQALAGLEYEFDRQLRGRDGRRPVVTDARRRAIFTDIEGYEPPQDGLHLVLTIDAAIQAITEQALAATVAQYRARAGSAVVIVPATGEVLAMANVPTFDVNEFGSYPKSVRCNLAIQAPVEPGSTFKPFIASAALQEKVTWAGEQIFCHHGLYVTGRRRLHDHHPYGHLTFEEVVVKSSNIGMAILGQRLGNQRLHAYMRRFGFGQATGIELPGEDVGIVLPLRRWTSYSTTSVPMGQEVAVTTIQLATAFSAIVNDGVLLRPRVVRGVIRSDGSIEEDRSTAVVVGRVLSTPIARKMARDILVRVVKEGTGRRAALARYQVLGKTGTAQMAYRNRRGFEPDAYVSSFVGAAPASEPRVLAYLSITRPEKRLGYYGGQVAAPAVGEILDKTLCYLGVPPTLDASAPEQKVARR